MDGNPIKPDPHCPICKMKDNEILKLENECRELQEKYIAMLEDHIGILKPEPSKKTHLRVV